MTDTVHVVAYYPELSTGPCGYMRMGLYQQLLAEHGIEIRPWTDFDDFIFQVPPEYLDRPREAIRDGLAQFNWTPIEWADVILFRRWHATVPQCADCDTVASSDDDIATHCRTTGHHPHVSDILIRALFDTLVSRPELLRGRAIVYDTDDDLLATQPWTGFHRKVSAERDLIEQMLRRADLVTVTTPVLAARARVYNATVRVIRNAVDPGLYAAPPNDPAPSGEPRILYYGNGRRLRDYGVCRGAIDEIRRRVPDTRRVWIGAAHEPEIVAAVDEAIPSVDNVPGFVRALVDARPDIGVAPVVGDAYDRAKSELHWIDYSLAGAATVASRTIGGGPYDVIRDGVDGLLARNRTQWREALGRLAASPALREDLAGRARERVLAEYDARDRAKEWADAYRWAAEHGGRGALGRLHLVGGPGTADALDPIATRSRAALVYRQRVRTEIGALPGLLAGLRGNRDVCWPEVDASDPLVSVIIDASAADAAAIGVTVDALLVEASPRREVLLVGAAPPEVMSFVTDPRIRALPAPDVGPPDDPEVTLDASRARTLEAGRGAAHGAWLVHLRAGDVLDAGTLEALLEAAVTYRLEVVYGQSLWRTGDGDGDVRVVGSWPPEPTGIETGAALEHAALRAIPFDSEAGRDGESVDAQRWRRLILAGVRLGNVEEVVHRGRPWTSLSVAS